MERLKAVDIFRPSDFPEHTYVERAQEKLERKLRDALDTPGDLISISGPSKSGKTVLVEKVVGDDLITVTGAGISDAEQLWNRVLDIVGASTQTTTSTAWTVAGTAGVSASGKAGIPLVAEGSAGTQLSLGATRTASSGSTAVRRGLAQVVTEFQGTNFVILIDDFHYMRRDVQTEVAKQLKEAARQGIKLCVASVPHRADDVVRSNPELRGRVRAVDVDYWPLSDLEQIAQLGFPKLNVEVNHSIIRRVAEEASGSPQLMQALCLQLCFQTQVRETLPQLTASPSLSSSEVNAVFEETAARTDFSSLVRKMHAGPRTRGVERKDFRFKDGSKGDVYRCVLLALAESPPLLKFGHASLSARAESVCSSESPKAQSINQACSQIAKMALDMYPEQRVVEWDDDDCLLDVVDPYFLFYVRWSGRLKSLAEAG